MSNRNMIDTNEYSILKNQPHLGRREGRVEHRLPAWIIGPIQSSDLFWAHAKQVESYTHTLGA